LFYGKIVVNDKPFGNHVMKGIALRKRKSFPNIPCLMLAQRAIPTLHVRRLSALFANRLVRFLRKDIRIGIPEIAVGNTTAILHWNFVPQTATGRFAPIPDHKGDDLSGSTAHHRPQPAFMGLLEHKAPGFIIFQDIGWFRGQQSILQFG